MIISALTLAHLQKWKPNIWIRGIGTKPDTIAKSSYTFFTRFELPFSTDANTKSSSAPDSERKLTYLPASISEMLTQVCAELTHVTEAL